MSSSNDHANREEGKHQSFILQAMQQHFARLKVQMNDMRDRIEQNDTELSTPLNSKTREACSDSLES